MFTCQEVIQALTDYLESDMAAEEKAVFEQHMTDCGPCRHFLNTYETSSQLARHALETENIPPEVQTRVRNFLKAKLGLNQ